MATTITASLVKELRERTGAGMMECKKALVEAGGDIDQAIEAMRKAGSAKAVKKAGRVAAEGVVVLAKSADGQQVMLLEVNSETDFVAREERFQAFACQVAEIALQNQCVDVAKIAELNMASGSTVEAERLELITKIGENIALRRAQLINSNGMNIAAYLHGGEQMARIGVVMVVEGGDEELARDLAMHVAAMNPEYITEQDIPAERKEKEQAIFLESARQENPNKPDDILTKIVSGKVAKFFNEKTLLGQPFVKDTDKKVAKLLTEKKAVVKTMVRFEVGEGIEKKEEDFVQAVMSQVQDQ